MPTICRQIKDDISGGSNTGANPARKRKWHPKTFAGCLRCKSRKIKCDETHPGCLRCAKAFLPCPGYRPPTARLFEPRSGPHFDSVIDELNYKHFVHVGSAILARFQLNALPFWTQLAPQLGETNDAVRHALLALGSIQAPLHRTTIQNLPQDKRPEWSLVALKHISKAMNLLRAADPDTLSIETILTCCVLFLAVEIWTEKKTHSTLHILAAHNILNGKRAASEQCNAVTTVYKPMVDELIVQACTFGDDFPPPDSQLSYYYGLDHGLAKVHAIRNWEDALDVMIQLLRCILRVTSKPVSCPTRNKVSSALVQFGDVLEKLQTAGTPPSDGCTAKEEYRHLRIHHRVAHIMLHALGQGDESSYDDLLEDFGFVLTCCKAMMTGQAAQSHNLISPTLGLLPPLFLVATKCRDSLIRHEALRILHDTSVTERQWTSCMATALARFVVEQEEEATLVSKRIRLLHAHFSGAEQKMELQYAVFIDGHLQGAHKAILPYESHPSVEIDGVTATMSRKVLRACGYTGLMLFTPPIDCHCVESLLQRLFQRMRNSS
ncbi:hypothetical protein EDD37DRAFT_143019 [Exophiala viscosa]|uniref:Zn(2)-C6 fungal-type domain-containing protein n=1 Tax=Exophiala viscosa TaxID=2486360 RepID=A0AAN6I9I2_9EURO|nr:hypothetical protein EDD36DRAFT_86682 [Exophiala viscosa]KAI1621061.1 hypothetical protein EDD37DRAFT_143019 [Exophiala viscosa]